MATIKLQDHLESPVPSARRRWRQRLCRAAVLALLLILAAYALLPWYLPTATLRDMLAKRLSEQMGVSVSIESLSVSWSQGVQLGGVKIGSPKGFAGPLADVATVQADFAPLTFLFRNRLDWVEIDRPQLFVQVDADGNSSTSAFSSHGGQKDELLIGRTSVRQAIVSVRLPNEPRVLRLQVSDLQVLSGRLERVGRVTMSAALEQNQSLAPMSLRLWAQSGRERLAGGAFNFTNVQLDQLMLPKLLALPISKLAGQCSGSVDLKLNDKGVVDRFDLSVNVHQLDVQSDQGPRLPVFDEAGVSLSAVCDFFPGQTDAQKVDIESLRVRVPGVDLSGRASLLLDLPEGQLEQIRQIELAGTTDPSQLATLLTGSRELPGDLAIDGPIAVRFSALRQDNSLALEIGLDGTGAVFRRGQTVLKPVGRAMQWDLTGLVDDRQWRFTADKSTFVLGDNEFTGRGSVREIVDIAEHLRHLDAPSAPRDILEHVARLEWRGGWELRDLPALAQIAPSLAPALGRLSAQAPLKGQFSLAHKEGSRLSISLTVPASAHLRAPGFRQPDDQAVFVQLSALLPDDASTLRDVDAEFVVGDAALRLTDATLALGDLTTNGSPPANGATLPGDPSRRFAAEGLWEVEQVEKLLACTDPILPAGLELSGTIRGRASLRLDASDLHAILSANLAPLRAAWRTRFVKPAQQPFDVRADLFYDRNAAADRRHRARLEVRSAYAELSGEATWPDAGMAALLLAKGSLRVSDAQALVAAAPPLRTLLGEQPVGGSAKLDLSGQWRSDEGFAFDLRADADALRLGEKDAQTPLGASASGWYLPREGGRARLELTSATVRAARSCVKFSGAASAALPDDLSTLALSAVDSLRGRLTATVMVDDALCCVFPAARQAVSQYGLSGSAAFDARFALDASTATLAVSADAASLGVQRLGPLAKPAGVAAAVELAADWPRDGATLAVRKLRAVLGEAGALADASLRRPAPGAPLQLATAHASLWSRNSETLSRVLPELAGNDLRGGVTLDLTLDNDKDLLSLVDLHTDSLSARLGNRPLGLSGNARITQLHLRPDALPEIAAVLIDGLDFRIGDNQGTILVDLAQIPDKTTGSVQLLAQYIDDQDLARFFANPADPAAPPAASQPSTRSAATRSAASAAAAPKAANSAAAAPRSAAKSKPAPSAPPSRAGEFLCDLLGRDRAIGKLFAPAVAPVANNKTVEQRAEDAIKELRRILGGCAFTVSAGVDRYKTFDPKVGQTYDARFLQLDAGVDHGQVVVEYNVGVNGGTDRVKIQTNFNDLTPAVNTETTLRDVRATAEIRPQIEAYFPGNIVQGYFSRTEQRSMPLRDLVANLIDSRYPLHPVGWARTVTTDGYVEGQGAPKFVTRIFPGLNLTRYNYNSMTGFAEFKADGSAQNDMIFSGTYDVYIEGSTGPDNWGEYDIGVILTPGSPEWNHNWKQGRVPILKFKGRIEGGKILDQTVTYLWPNETLFKIFLENNVVYRLWLNRQTMK